jgi:hypothetical protein
MPKHVCDIEGCENEITPGTGSKGGLPICKSCRSTSYAYKKKGPKEILARKEKLVFWEHRLDYLHPRIVKMLADAERRVTSAKRLAAKG